jgi:rare lipoprotein A
MKQIIVAIVIAFALTAGVQSQQISSTFKQEGIASWYGADFDGQITASGELFDSSQLTAAHPTLSFGTLVKVTNKDNNRSVTVRINDRGPSAADRIIDLSQAAADQLGYIGAGSAVVVVEAVPETAPPSRTAATILPALPSTGTDKRYRIQVGSYKVARNAVNTFDRLKSVDLSPAYEKNGDYYRVVLAGINADDVPDIAEKLARAGFVEALIREEPGQ